MFNKVRTVAVAAALLLSTGAVSAQQVIDDAVETLASDWLGSYAGAFAGGVGVSLDGDFGSGDFEASTAGVYGGHDFELPGGVVFGIESDVGMLDGDASFDFDEDSSAKFAIDWAAHLRSRIGLAVEQALFYVAGGVALASGEFTSEDGSDTQLHTGVTIGAGVDFAVTDSVVLRAEYLHDAFGTATYEVGGESYEVDLSADTVRAGIAFKF